MLDEGAHPRDLAVPFGIHGVDVRRRRLPRGQHLHQALAAQIAGDVPFGAKHDAERLLKRVNGIAHTSFTSADEVRHPLVARIVDAYDAARKKEA